MADAFGRPMREGDHIFVINNRYAFEGLFMQDRFMSMPGAAGTATILSDSGDTEAAVGDDHTIVIWSGADDPMLSGFLGQMGTTRGHARAEGETMRGLGFEAKVVKTGAGLRSVELRFDEPISSDNYQFFKVRPDGVPEEWSPANRLGDGAIKRPG